MLVGTRRSSWRRGMALVELAVILILLFMVVLGAIDFGRFAYDYVAVTNAVRAGGEYGIMNPYTNQTNWSNQIREVARDEMETQNHYVRTDLAVTVTPTIEAPDMRRVRVAATYPFQTLVDWPGIPRNLTIRRSVSLRIIR